MRAWRLPAQDPLARIRRSVRRSVFRPCRSAERRSPHLGATRAAHGVTASVPSPTIRRTDAFATGCCARTRSARHRTGCAGSSADAGWADRLCVGSGEHVVEHRQQGGHWSHGTHILYCDCANRPVRRVFCYADGETLIVPPQGQLARAAECGLLDSSPRDIAVAPRGVRCRVALPDGQARGHRSENHGPALRLPDLRPNGEHGLAPPRDVLAPAAWFEDSDGPTEVTQKFVGVLWVTARTMRNRMGSCCRRAVGALLHERART